MPPALVQALTRRGSRVFWCQLPCLASGNAHHHVPRPKHAKKRTYGHEIIESGVSPRSGRCPVPEKYRKTNKTGPIDRQ